MTETYGDVKNVEFSVGLDERVAGNCRFALSPNPGFQATVLCEMWPVLILA